MVCFSSLTFLYGKWLHGFPTSSRQRLSPKAGGPPDLTLADQTPPVALLPEPQSPWSPLVGDILAQVLGPRGRREARREPSLRGASGAYCTARPPGGHHWPYHPSRSC